MRYFVKTPWWLKRIYPNRLWQVDTEEKIIYLSFDDGPHPVNTEKVLNALEAANLHVNFFVLGKNARAYPELIKEEASRGHSMGGHSMPHANLPKLNTARAEAEIVGVFEVIKGILGGVDPFFRFPYGSRTKFLRDFVEQNHLSDFFWNIDTLDWKHKDPNVLLPYALRQTKNTGRGIILFHDIQPQTAAILPMFLEEVSRAGFDNVVYEPK